MSRGRAEIGTLGLAGLSPLCREAIRPHPFCSDGGRDGAESISAAVDAGRWYRHLRAIQTHPRGQSGRRGCMPGVHDGGAGSRPDRSASGLLQCVSMKSSARTEFWPDLSTGAGVVISPSALPPIFPVPARAGDPSVPAGPDIPVRRDRDGGIRLGNGCSEVLPRSVPA